MRRSLFAGLVLGLVGVVLLWVVSTALAAGAAVQTPGPWQDIDPASLQLDASRSTGPAAVQIEVDQGRYLRLDVPAMRAQLGQAPVARMPGAADALATSAGFELELPMPDGSWQRFAVVESPIMAPELAAKYPQIKTYAGQSLDDPTASVRLDMTPQGFHAMVLQAGGAVYIDPLYQQRDDLYVAYDKTDLVVDPTRLVPELPPLDPPADTASAPLAQLAPQTSSGTQLRTYRLAVAATGEYTVFQGGTQAAGLAAIVTAMNRVNGIYEKEVAVTMVLVANNDLVVYTDPNTDPYTNNSPSTLLSQNQTNLDSVLGNSAYDIGHVFSTGGGGLAQLRTPCSASSKARGETGLSKPTGDAFWVDYVAHEMGHQFSAYHTFNGSTGSCSGSNRSAAYAYEPGSGSTIMAYAGICGTQDLQKNSDAYFHSISFEQIVAYTTSGTGNTCAVTTATGNRPPTILLDSGGFTIPRNTPFILSGTASDPDGDALTYQWEQFDVGSVAGAPPGVSGYVTPPHFRSFSPTSDPWRYFPRLQDVINNTVSVGEVLPSTATTLHFRFTARDNRLGGGGVSNDSYTVAVSGTAGPFRVTSPNSAVLWPVGSSQAVTWDVANTDVAPVSCSKVDIKLSTDSGHTYPITLAQGVANDGSQEVTLPFQVTSTARVQVACTGHIFFDISDADFSLIENRDLQLHFTDIVNPVYVTDTLTYTLAAANTGDVPLTAAVVTDTLPAEVTYLSDTVGCTSISSGVLRCVLGDLAVGETRSFQIVVRVPGVPGVLANQALASFTGIDRAPEDNQASLETTVLPADALNLKLDPPAGPSVVYVGQLFTYTLTAANQSLVPVTGVMVTDTLPSQVTYQSASPGCTAGAGGPTVVLCALGDMGTRASQPITIQVLAPSSAVTLTNQAAIGSAGPDDYSADNQVELETAVLDSSDLALQMSGPSTPQFTLADLTYALTVTNVGPSTAYSLTLTDNLPAGTGFVRASSGCTYAGGQVTCPLDSLAPGAAQSYTLVLSAPETAGSLVNQAQVSAVTHDPDITDNQAETAVAVNLHGFYLPLVVK